MGMRTYERTRNFIEQLDQEQYLVLHYILDEQNKKWVHHLTNNKQNRNNMFWILEEEQNFHGFELYDTTDEIEKKLVSDITISIKIIKKNDLLNEILKSVTNPWLFFPVGMVSIKKPLETR
jgi:hypothetical protein